MKLRHPFAVLAAAALAVAALTGCQTNVGTAAHVDDHSISASEVEDLLDPLVGEELAASGRTAGEITFIGRNLVTTWLIREQVFEQMWDKRGGLPTGEQVDEVHDRAIQFLFNSTEVESGTAGDDAVRAALSGTGVDGAFAQTMIRAASLELVLADEIDSSSEADVIKLVADEGIEVRVNPRYGVWDASTLSLGATALPSYVKDASAPATTAASS